MSDTKAGGGAERELTNEATKGLIPFAGAPGIELVSAEPERVEGRLACSEDRCTAGGVLHGGALMAMADTFCAVCAHLNPPPGATTGTIESKTNFFRAVREGRVDSASRLLHAGRSIIVVQTDLLDGDGGLVAQTTQTRAVLGGGRG